MFSLLNNCFGHPSIHGGRLGIGYGNLVMDGRAVMAPYYDRGAIKSFEDHFDCNAINPAWLNTLVGTDGSAAVPAVDQASGIVLTTGADAGATMALNGSELVSALAYDRGTGGLEFDVVIKMSRITNACVYVGLTDSISLEMPFTISAATLTSNATDGMGMLFDTAATAATWKFVRVANDVDGAIYNTGLAPTAATYEQFHIDVDEDGSAKIYHDGKLIANGLTGCSTSGVKLTPCVAAFSRTSTSMTVTADYVGIRSYR